MTSGGSLDQISKDLDEAVKRIEKIQAAEKPPLAQRFTNHVRKHGNNLTSLLLAGCLFFVALGRLDLKNSLQVELGLEAGWPWGTFSSTDRLPVGSSPD